MNVPSSGISSSPFSEPATLAPPIERRLAEVIDARSSTVALPQLEEAPEIVESRRRLELIVSKNY